MLYLHSPCRVLMPSRYQFHVLREGLRPVARLFLPYRAGRCQRVELDINFDNTARKSGFREQSLPSWVGFRKFGQVVWVGFRNLDRLVGYRSAWLT